LGWVGFGLDKVGSVFQELGLASSYVNGQPYPIQLRLCQKFQPYPSLTCICARTSLAHWPSTGCQSWVFKLHPYRSIWLLLDLIFFLS